MTDRSTIQVYEDRAADYEASRTPRSLTEASALGARRGPGVAVDLGCGPGWYTTALGTPVVALDAARSMVERTRQIAPRAMGVQADLGALPFRRGRLAAGWARNTYVHLQQADLPMALNDLHHSLAPGAPVELTFFAARARDEQDVEGRDAEGYDVFPDDDFPGRWFSTWTEGRLRDVLDGAGFVVDELVRESRRPEDATFIVRGHRHRALPDFVGAGMRVLVSGLNPSVHAADAGVGYVTPGNRFWPAALGAGLATVDRDARHALRHHGVGMTDVVKRATARADELSTAEYRHGMARLERLCAWLQPGVVCFVGLAGWRAAVDRKAVAGWQAQELGARPVYVLPSTSGLNAATPLATLIDHLRAVAAGPSPT